MRVVEPFSLALEPYEFSSDFGMQSSFSHEDEWEARTPSPSRVCTICAAPSNGYHFNAASCSACAAFFRRTVTLNRNFACAQQGNCRVNYAMRVICRACRYSKCLSMGMERSAVQPRRDCNVGRRKISYSVRPPPPAQHVFQEQTQQSPEMKYAASYSSSVSGDAPSPHVPWSPQIPSPETILEDLIKEERLLNERRKLLYCSNSSVSHLLSSAPLNDIPFEQKDLKELSFAGIRENIRPQILVLFEWMRGWQHFPALEPRDRKTLLRRCLLYHTILDPSYLTLRLGLPNRFVMFNGMYVGISEDSNEGWQNEEGCINSEMKRKLYRPLMDRALNEICYPMRDIGLTYIEFLFLKALVSFKSASVADVAPAVRELMLSYIDQLFRALHVHYLSQGASPDYIAQRTGNIVLLISSVFAVGMECFENHQKIQFFDLWQLDDLLLKLISAGGMS